MLEDTSIKKCLDDTSSLLANDDAHEKFAAHVALMRLGIESRYAAGEPVYTLTRVEDDTAVLPDGLNTALRLDYAQLIALAGKLFTETNKKSSIVVSKSVLDTIMFRDMQIWAENESYWNVCAEALGQIPGGKQSVRRLFIYDRQKWFDTSWTGLAEDDIEGLRKDAVGFLFGLRGHVKYEWPWMAISLEEVKSDGEAFYLFGDQRIHYEKNGKGRGAAAKFDEPRCYQASSLLGLETVLYIYGYEAEKELGLPKMYWLKFCKRKYGGAAEGFAQAFKRMWRRGSSDITQMEHIWQNSPNYHAIEELVNARNAEMPSELQFFSDVPDENGEDREMDTGAAAGLIPSAAIQDTTKSGDKSVSETPARKRVDEGNLEEFRAFSALGANELGDKYATIEGLGKAIDLAGACMRSAACKEDLRAELEHLIGTMTATKNARKWATSGEKGKLQQQPIELLLQLQERMASFCSQV